MVLQNGLLFAQSGIGEPHEYVVGTITTQLADFVALAVSATPSPSYSGSTTVDANLLSAIGGSSPLIYEAAALRLEMVLTNGLSYRALGPGSKPKRLPRGQFLLNAGLATKCSKIGQTPDTILMTPPHATSAACEGACGSFGALKLAINSSSPPPASNTAPAPKFLSFRFVGCSTTCGFCARKKSCNGASGWG
jgi:hypothetical protein